MKNNYQYFFQNLDFFQGVTLIASLVEKDEKAIRVGLLFQSFTFVPHEKGFSRQSLTQKLPLLKNLTPIKIQKSLISNR